LIDSGSIINARVLRIHVCFGQEYYTVHGVDANFVAREMFKSEGVLKYFGQGKDTFCRAIC